MALKGRHVVPSRDGWAVRKAGADRASTVTDTKSAAEQAAKKMLAREGGGRIYVHSKDGRITDKYNVSGGDEVRIHGRNGKIRDTAATTVKGGRDPNPPKDKKH